MRRWVGLLLSVALTLWGCGNSGSSNTDASAPDGSQSIDASALRGDGGGGDGGSGSPYALVTCEAVVDAGVLDAGATRDAAPLTAATDAGASADGGVASDGGVAGDGGAPPGTGDPCCSPGQQCGAGLVCIQGPGGSRTCRPTCDLGTNVCPAGGLCANFGGQGACIPVSTEGQQCDPELCDAATICVGTSADNAVCRRRCAKQSDCPTNQTCTALQGASAMACLPN